MALIDELAVELPRNMDGATRVKSVLYQAKHFVFDLQASAFIRMMAEESRALVMELQEFALPPFDVMAISNVYADDDAARFRASEIVTLWDHGEFKLLMKAADGSGLVNVPGWTAAHRGFAHVRNEALDVSVELSPSTRPAGSPGVVTVTGENGAQRVFEGGEDEFGQEFDRLLKTDKGEDMKTAFALLQHRFMLDATFLLMAQPRFYTSIFGEARRVIRKGRVVPFYARTEIKLDLTAPRELHRAFLTGARGSPRRHDVRRHFCHYRGDRSCAHAWEPMISEDGKHRWECPNCGMIRVERGPFGRGDANKGFVRQSYAVTAGGI